MIHLARVTEINQKPLRENGQYVLYWMQQAMRTRYNHALEFAIDKANELNLPLLVCFGIIDNYPEANLRHYAFLVGGLSDVAAALGRRKIKFVIRHNLPPKNALYFSKNAAMVVHDRGYVRIIRAWHDDFAKRVDCKTYQIETDAVVPVQLASNKQEFAARTIRPKIHKQLAAFMQPLRERKINVDSFSLNIESDFDLRDVDAVLAKLQLDRSVPRSKRFVGGEVAAQKRLQKFVRDLLPNFINARRMVAEQATSNLSPHLHFGNISPLEIALAVESAKTPPENRDAFLEELIVRRELAINFTFYCDNYDTYDAVPSWARQTLKVHAKDKRPKIYSLSQLENAQTNDPFWNAAQLEMTRSGFMHNQLRMYWGKKILEWSRSPRIAYKHAIYLNNKYFLCGRDMLSWMNVGWLFGLHDRPWGPQRPIFGMVRYMNAAGLERKFDMPAYLKFVDSLK